MDPAHTRLFGYLMHHPKGCLSRLSRRKLTCCWCPAVRAGTNNTSMGKHPGGNAEMIPRRLGPAPLSAKWIPSTALVLLQPRCQGLPDRGACHLVTSSQTDVTVVQWPKPSKRVVGDVNVGLCRRHPKLVCARAGRREWSSVIGRVKMVSWIRTLVSS